MIYGRTGLQWDKSLYGKINAVTQAEVNRINGLAQAEFPQEYENEWGNRTTLRAKTAYLMELRLADEQKRRREPTIEEDAQAYVDLLNGPANGLGQHRCPTTGMDSHHVLRAGSDRHGEINFQDAVDAIFKEARHDIHRHRST